MYDEIGSYAEAAEHFDAVVKLQPDSAPAHYNLGTVLSSLGRTDEAMAQFREALRIEPRYALAHNNLGHALVMIGKPDEARREFSEAARLDAKLADPHYNLGAIDVTDGNLAAAAGEFRQAVALQPDWIQPVKTLAWLLATAPSESLRNGDEAVQLASHAADLTHRGDPEVLDILAAAQAAAGRFDAAVATCEEALALKPPATLAASIGEHQSLYKQRRSYTTNGVLPPSGQ